MPQALILIRFWQVSTLQWNRLQACLVLTFANVRGKPDRLKPVPLKRPSTPYVAVLVRLDGRVPRSRRSFSRWRNRIGVPMKSKLLRS